MQLSDILPVEIGGPYGGASGVSRNKVRSLTVEVHKHHDGVILMRVQKLDNEVHQGYAPLFSRDQERVELTHRELAVGFCL